MRGISEERLRELVNEGSLDERNTLEFLIRTECQELNPWRPIDENTPRDRMILIWDDNHGHCAVAWNEFYLCFTSTIGYKYYQATHWQELPKEPE